jgi:phage shock protein PspC (stress-responsive transcriptional regulator)
MGEYEYDVTFKDIIIVVLGVIGFWGSILLLIYLISLKSI